MKKRLRYKNASVATFKDDGGVLIENAYHVCGCKMLECTGCKSIFCSECDSFFTKAQVCCKNAIEAYTDDCMEKEMKLRKVREETESRIRTRKRIKTKVKIEEIGVGL